MGCEGGVVPSVIVILLDDVAVHDLALYGGSIPTQYLSLLAASGVRFTNCYSHAWCAPSRRSVLFGSWHQNGSGGLCTSTPNADTPGLAEVSIADALWSHSSALIGKWHCGSSPTGGPWQQAPIEHGFDYWGAGVPGNISADQPCGAPTNATYTNWLRVDADPYGYSTSISTTYHGIAVRDFFINGWGAAPKPALAVITPQLPHAPFHVPPQNLLPAGYPIPTSNREKFEAMVIAADKLIGQILAHVNMDETLVFVVGDNGTPPNAGGGMKSKGTCYERGVRVPLIVAGGPVVGNRVSGELVHIVDVYATALDACGITPGGDGHSFLNELVGASFSPRPFAFIGNRWEDPGNLPNSRAAVSGFGMKLIQNDPQGDGTVNSEELYDVIADPGETTNLIATHAADAVALRSWLESVAP